ncbi:FERM and PDZ domain-containing protein 2 [Tachysurus fulvidraco]|uniref:FERM and PDZ domain-containing protein 2 n=1 Tax=Tachysurus fulvidraco TaxID=1234273 RepID=UPI001FEF48D3|nr:FERM and PDZ domain-containing protein 2 [Tachysurus fulvidraco]
MSTFVSLLEVLEVRGSALDEDEVWAILIIAAETLTSISNKGPGNLCSIITPGSILISPSGSVAFKTCSRTDNVASFTSPEMAVAQSSSSKEAVERMLIYSLGMTLYWAVDYHIPPDQPIQLTDHLNSLLLSMCEEEFHRRLNLQAVLQQCEKHQKNALLLPPERTIKQLVQDVLQHPAENVLTNRSITDQSQLIRHRLRGGYTENSACIPKAVSSPSHIVQAKNNRSSYFSHHRGSTSSAYLDTQRQHNDRSNQSFDSSLSLSERKLKNLGPEFVRILDEPFITLELPSSIVSKKWKSCSTQRDVRVIMPNGQTIVVKCDVKTRGGDVFDMIIAHSKMVEHFYFGLAYTDNTNEFFFLDNNTKISKIAPESWKKVPTSTFVLHVRIKFFITDVSLLLHKLTQHQYYMQLRRDILEDRLPYTEETGLFLSALALQAEFGDILPEMYGREYYQPEHYIPKSLMEKMSLPFLKQELQQLHANNANMTAEESELEFLKAIQQLPQYGMLFHHVVQEKMFSTGELLLGVCTTGIAVYEVKSNIHTMRFKFHWRETINIFAVKRKFIIVSGISKKKHTFLMEKSRIASYLCSLCTAQHKFHKEMSSRQLSHSLVSEDTLHCEISSAQNDTSRRISLFERNSNDGRPDVACHDSMSKLCDDIANRIETKIKQQRYNSSSQDLQKFNLSSKRSFGVSSIPSFLRETPTSHRAPAREILCVTLTKDVKLGLGIIIVGEDSASGLDLGIFIASVVPGGPANRDGRIRPGSRLISLNQISLEGVPFNEAAEIIQSSPNQVELIISQSKGKNENCIAERYYELPISMLYLRISVDSPVGDGLDELVTVMMTPKTGRSLHGPKVHVLSVQADLIQRDNLATV